MCRIGVCPELRNHLSVHICREREQSVWQALEMNEDMGPKALGIRL